MLHTTAQQRYQKLKRVFGRLMRNFNRDDLDEFILTANSLREWIQRDAALNCEQRKAVEAFALRRGVDWQICHQIANQQKHVRAKPPKNSDTPVVTAVSVVPGGKGFLLPPSMQVIGAGEDITVECSGTTESALAFAIRTFRHYHYIFEIIPLPLTNRTKAATMTLEFFGF
jgi:hypothetical protein